MMWSEVYRPLKIEQMVGNEDARLAVVKWLTAWVNGVKPLLLVGPPGVGKTSLVHALAQQYDYDLIEMNASDTRNREDLEDRIMPMFNNASIFGRTMLLFLDEVDGISGREDTGGIESIIKMMKETTIPVIMAANNQDTTKIKELVKVCKVIKFNPVPPRLLMIFLNYILKKEKKKLNLEEKISIINSSHGDIRSLLNSMQSKSAAGYDAVREDNFEIDIASAINNYFSSDEPENAKAFLSRANATYLDPRFGMSSEERRKDMINALFSSIVSSHVDLCSIAAMLDALSKVDVIVGRIGENRQWSLMKYLDDIIAYGLFEESRNKGIKYNQYSMIWPIMGPIFMRGQSLKNLMLDLAHQTHTSKSTFGSMYMPYMLQIMIDNKVDPEQFAEILNLDEKYGEVLAKEMKRAWRGN
jgi:replication factor C large subunit